MESLTRTARANRERGRGELADLLDALAEMVAAFNEGSAHTAEELRRLYGDELLLRFLRDMPAR